jgi:WhiB family transcriptional regulator, redox-sensing transcriptional regulator
VNLIMETLSSVGPDQAVEPVSMDLLREPLVAAETFGAETFEPGSFGAATFGTDSFGSESFTAGTLGGDAAEEPGWQEQALCAQTDPEAFFPEKGGSTREAKKVCLGCEVRAECLEYALEHDERFGIWGGLSERERRKLKRRVV